MSVYDDIRSALEVRLFDTPNVPPIEAENVDYEPVTGQAFIKIQLVPASRRPATRGRSSATGKPYQHRYQGAFIMLIHAPTDEGAGYTDDLVEKLVDTFEASTDIEFTNDDGKTVYVTVHYVERNRSYQEKPWYKTPVTVSWYCYDN